MLCGFVWCCVVLCGDVLYGIVWCCVVQYCVVCAVWCGLRSVVWCVQCCEVLCYVVWFVLSRKQAIYAHFNYL